LAPPFRGPQGIQIGYDGPGWKRIDPPKKVQKLRSARLKSYEGNEFLQPIHENFTWIYRNRISPDIATRLKELLPMTILNQERPLELSAMLQIFRVNTPSNDAMPSAGAEQTP
jgi:hypothetical protein